MKRRVVFFTLYIFSILPTIYSRKELTMNAKEIVNELAKNRVVEKLLSHFNTVNKADLAQNIYMSLLLKDDDFLTDLYTTNRLNYYLIGAIRNEVMSNTSIHSKENRKAGLIKGEVEDIYDSSKKYDVVDEDYESIADKVVDFLNTLSEAEKEIAWLFPMLNYDKEKKEEIDIICHNYGITYNQYKKMLPKIKKKFQEHFKKGLVGKKFQPRIKDEVLQQDTAGNIIAIYDNLRDAADKLGFSIDSIRRCCNSDRKTYKGYIFKFKKNI